MDLTRSYFSGRNDFTLLINAPVDLIFKLGFSFPAALTYDLSYPDLKRMARNSPEYSFLAGEIL
jgi:hypothetical protein